MMPPERDQTDIGLVDVTVDASDSEDNKDMARQEYKNEADINYMLSRFGVTQPRGAPTYGEWDDTQDLQSSIESVREAKAGFMTLPKELRDKFDSMEGFLKAVDNGSLKITDKDAPSEAATAPPPQQT